MLDEFGKIDRIRGKSGRAGRGVIVGIGDDAAVLRGSGKNWVATVDAQVESVHFDLRYATAAEVGHRALAASLSDVAAMGANPRFALVSLALPSRGADPFLTGFYQGFAKLARRHGVALVGGNLARSPRSIFADCTVLGEVAGKALKRSGARPGEIVGLLGQVGESAAGLALLRRLGRAGATRRFPQLVRAHLLPRPWVEEGPQLARFASSAIDVSDGLAAELGHLAKASRCVFVLDKGALPLSKALRAGAETLRVDPADLALHGGEDYALLFTTPARHWKRLQALFGARVRSVGRTVVGPAKVWLGDGKKRIALAPRGFNHFGPP